jgi:DNA invertase Pin-like site-specific DNA recombinase
VIIARSRQYATITIQSRSTEWSTRTGGVALDPSLSYLIGLMGELQARDVDLYLHRHALDTSTRSGRMLFGMLGVLSERLRRTTDDSIHSAAYPIGIG